MYNEKIESLIKAALADGVLTEKEKQVLFKRAQEAGIDLDEFEMVLDARLVELQKEEKEKAAKSAPKSDKYGSVRKCPACGAIVGAFQGVCPECGFEFTEVDANLSSKKLYEALAKESNIRKKQEIIETFPLPNTKADLLEFLTALKPRILDTSSEFANAYYKKYAECIEKAKVTFANDKQLLPFINDFSILKKTILRNKSINILKKYWKIIIPALVILIWIITSVINSISTRIEEKKLKELRELQIEQFEEYVKTKDIENAIKLLGPIEANYEYGSLYPSEDIFYELIVQCVNSNNDIKTAIDVYYKYHYRGCGSTFSSTKIEDFLKQKCLERNMYDELKRLYFIGPQIEYADDCFEFMSDVVYYLCNNNRKTDARNFVKNYIVWFVKHVDTSKNYSGLSDWVKEYYKTYNSQTVKTKLYQFINNN